MRHESFSSRLNDGSHHRSLSGLSVEPHAQVLDLHSCTGSQLRISLFSLRNNLNPGQDGNVGERMTKLVDECD